MIRRNGRLARWTRRLLGDEAGVAMIEFAYAAPVITVLGCYGLEAVNLGLANLRVSQAAASMADNISRVGLANPLGVKTLREADINESFAALRAQSVNWQLTTYGRVIVSSLERNSNGDQWIHWQRCIGVKNYASTYGLAGAGAVGQPVIAGMGPTGQEIQAPANGAVMFVEIAYDYQPLISNTFFGEQLIKAKGAFIVRDQRTLADPNNPSNPSPAATVAACNVFSA